MRKQLGVKKGQDFTLTTEQYDKYYANPDPTNKQFPWKWVTDDSGALGDSNRVNGQGAAGVAAVGDDEIHNLNVGAVFLCRGIPTRPD